MSQRTCMQGATLRSASHPFMLRAYRLRVHCTASPESGDADRPSSSKGKSFSGDRRRRGRPAHLRSPDDSPLRDGNRDRLMGLLTERAAKTLAYYLIETNHNMHHWVNRFIQEHPIPRDGNWDDVSGDTFLRTLMAMPIEAAMPWGRDPMFHNTSGYDVDPRSIAQRIMEIRSQLATEFVQDLQQVAADNKLLQLEALQASLLSTEDAIADGSAAARQAATSSSSSSSSSLDIGRSMSPGSSTDEAVAFSAASEAAEATARAARARRAKRSVLPAQPTPSNWRLRLEVEAQVHGDGDGSSAAAAALSGGGIPDSVQTGIISPAWTPAAAKPPLPEAAKPPPMPPLAAAAKPPPSLHPEVAELLPLIRSSPAALTPDVAQMLSSLAVLSSGQLHPDIVEALRGAVAAGAVLHPEMAELLRAEAHDATEAAAADDDKADAAGADTPISASAAPTSRTDPSSSAIDAGNLKRGGGGGGVEELASPPAAPLAQSGTQPPSVPSPPSPPSPSAAATSTAAASATSAAASALPQVVEAPKGSPVEAAAEEENSITSLQNDVCLHSDED